MATKIIETENGQIIEKSGKQVKTERIIRKTQKYITTAALVTSVIALSSVCAFAAADNSAPAGVQTDTMNGMADIMWWLVRIVILAVGGIPALIKIVQGKANEDAREFQSGISIGIVTGAVVGATFFVENLLGI